MSLTVSRILHAGYQFECGETKILFDPIFENPFSGNCFAYPAATFDLDKIRRLQPNAIFISHYHDDHCSFESLNYLDRRIPIYLYCVHDEIFGWLRELGFQQVFALKLNEPVAIGEITVIPRRALDPDVDSIFEIHGGGVSVLNVVDAWIDPASMGQLRESSWDLVLWPFQTMREIAVLAPTHAEAASLTLPPEWLEQLQILNPKNVVPSSCQFIHESWSWYNQMLFPITYRQFAGEIGATLHETQVLRLNPSESISLSANGVARMSPLSWVIPQGPQNVDYEFDSEIVPPTTAEIARQFEALTSEDFSKIYEYCREGLMQKYRALPPPQDAFFESARIWKLVVYNHDRIGTSFYYSVCGNQIEAANGGDQIDWLTELPAAKLFSAIHQGEALTSMYLRVQASKKDIDVLEDPLIRCLFTGVFGGYQREQMRKIKMVRDESRDHGLLR